MTQELLPISLYVHYPWCVRKCPYCDFNSRTLQRELDEPYLKALLEDYGRVREQLRGRSLRSVYLGGGTPSLMPLNKLERLLAAILPDCEEGCEISLEANPGTLSLERLQGWRSLGVNRLSLGVQSYLDSSLKSLGRIYGAHSAFEACEQVCRAGFDNFNLDLMHGTPGQTVEDALYDLRQALSFSPSHLSWYELTLEEGTPFFDLNPSLPCEEVLGEIEAEGLYLLSRAGFDHYEVSAFARSEACRCRHNLNYWQFGDYLGIGAGAHSKLYCDGVTIRRACPEEPSAYLLNFGTYREVVRDELPFEFLLNRLRLYGPVPLSEFGRTTGLDTELLRERLDRAEQLGLITLSEDFSVLELTSLGKTMLNDILMLFLQ